MHNLHRFFTGLIICILTINVHAASIQMPEIPATVRFATLNVKFDGKARAIIQTEISRLMANQKYWEEKLERAQLYFPIIETVLIDEEVPIDFKYLVAQESSFRPEAVSTSNAVGFWQMKKETAQGLGFRVDNMIDERKNITSSTQAAARYLKQNNQQLNNWVSSLYSYYLGLGGVSKVIPASWKNAREITLDSKTDIYLLRFFAHKIAIESELENFRSTNPYMLLDSPVGNGKTFQDISRALNIEIEDLKKYNIWTSTETFPGDKNYFVTLPIRKAYLSDVREKLYLVTSAGPVTTSTGPQYGLSNSKGTYPILERKPKPTSDGHNLFTINGLPGIQALNNDNAKNLASAGQIKAPKFLQYNDMGVNDPIVTNEVYYLAEKKRAAPIKFHTVREGETLQQIAQMYGIRLKDLLKYNRITSRNFTVETGRVLWMNEKRPRRTKIEIKEPGQYDTHPLNETTPVKETIAVTSPADEVKSSQQPQQENTIPANPSERKKYTPKIADKTISEPTTPVVTETPAQPEEIKTAPYIDANIYRPSTKPTSEVTSPVLPKGNDRIVIISGNNSESEPVENSGFDIEEPAPKPVPAPQTRTEISTPASPVATGTENYRYHTVTAGQTLFSISRQYKVPVADLLRLNRFPSNIKINTGQKIIIGTESDVTEVATSDPDEGWSKPAAAKEVEKATAQPAATQAGSTTHTVVRGETYYSVARKYNLTLHELLTLNNLTVNNQLTVGQILKVSGKASEVASNTPSAPVSESRVHQVKKGETLFAISRQYNVSVDEIKKLNNKKANTVIVGESLKIPSR